jgi:hypothetical protein
MVKRSILLHQKTYVQNVLKRFGSEIGHGAPTPMVPGMKLRKNEDSENTVKLQVLEYKSLVASLIYLSTSTRPDISFTVSLLSRYLDSPGIQHWNAIQHLLQYLYLTQNMGIELGRSKNFDMTVYTDSDWAGDIDLRRSTTGFVIYVDDSFVAWRSKRQSLVSLSSTEAEFFAITDAIKQTIWCKQFMNEVLEMNIGVQIMVDNLPCISLATKKRMFKGRTKHMDVKYKYVQQILEEQ